jgi:hypothetical protein
VKVKTQAAKSALLTTAGFACADAAGFDHSVFAGLIVTAGSLVLLGWLVESE